MIKGNKLFKTSKPNQTTHLKSDHIIDNSKGNQYDKSNRENNQGNLEIKPNLSERKTNHRENNLIMDNSKGNQLDKINRVHNQGNLEMQPNLKEYNSNQRENNLITIDINNKITTPA